MPGSAGFATRCNLKKGAIDLSANYWNEVYPYKVISGGTYANVTVKSVCDEHMNVTQQSIGDFRFSISTLYNSGTDKEKMLSATIVMLDRSFSTFPRFTSLRLQQRQVRRTEPSPLKAATFSLYRIWTTDAIEFSRSCKSVSIYQFTLPMQSHT